MFRTGFVISILVVLSACGDPLREMPRLSDLDLADDTAPMAQALPTEAEIAREGFFGTPSTTSIDGLMTAPVIEQPRPGLLGALRRAIPPVQPIVQGQGQSGLPVEGTQTEDLIEQDAVAVVAAVEPEAPQGGLFSRLRSGPAAPVALDGVDAVEVAYGTVLQFGKIARVCEARRKPMGRKIESATAKGYKLFDSNPGASGVRTYYITGFDDGCPRQLTAAHVVLGAPSFYELLHYGPTGAHLVTGETDHAYEKVKTRICGSRKGRPCGAKMKTLERDTFFVNAYERLDDNTQWSELLVHNGAVIAASLKTN